MPPRGRCSRRSPTSVWRCGGAAGRCGIGTALSPTRTRVRQTWCAWRWIEAGLPVHLRCPSASTHRRSIRRTVMLWLHACWPNRLYLVPAWVLVLVLALVLVTVTVMMLVWPRMTMWTKQLLPTAPCSSGAVQHRTLPTAAAPCSPRLHCMPTAEPRQVLSHGGARLHACAASDVSSRSSGVPSVSHGPSRAGGVSRACWRVVGTRRRRGFRWRSRSACSCAGARPHTGTTQRT